MRSEISKYLHLSVYLPFSRPELSFISTAPSLQKQSQEEEEEEEDAAYIEFKERKKKLDPVKIVYCIQYTYTALLRNYVGSYLKFTHVQLRVLRKEEIEN